MSWELKTLNELFDIARGGSPRPIEKFWTDNEDGINWIMISDATDSSKYITKTKKKIKKEGAKNSRSVEPGDFILTNSMSFGRPYIMGTYGCIHDGWLVLKPKSKDVHQDFFYHLLGSDFIYNEFSKRASGATVKNLNIDLVKGVTVPVPPIEEQKRISDILGKVDSLRAKRREAITLINSLTQSIFLEMFGDPETIAKKWPTKKLSDLLSFLTSGSRGWAEHYADSGDLFLRIQNVGRGELLLDDCTFVNAPETAEAKRTKVQSGDVLLSITADLGRSAVIPEHFGTAFINQHLAILRVQGINPYFLSSFFTSPAGQIQVLGRNKGGVKAGLNFDDIRSFTIPIPPEALQKEFLSRAQKASSLKKQLLEANAPTSDLFKSIQQQAFSGEL